MGSVVWRESTMASLVRFNLQIVASVIDVECVVESYDPTDDQSLLLIRAFQFTRSLTDCLAFTSGEGLTIIFDDLIEPDGNCKHIRFANDNLSRLAVTFNHSDTTGERSLAAMFALVGAEPALFLALNDLITAVSTPGLVAINCGRAIEGLRSILMPDDETRTTGWEVFRHVLNLDRSYTDYITKASVAPRHGNKVAVPGEAENKQLLEYSWTTMDRFLAFRKEGSIPLPLSRFPMLYVLSQTLPT